MIAIRWPVGHFARCVYNAVGAPRATGRNTETTVSGPRIYSSPHVVGHILREPEQKGTGSPDGVALWKPSYTRRETSVGS